MRMNSTAAVSALLSVSPSASAWSWGLFEDRGEPYDDDDDDAMVYGSSANRGENVVVVVFDKNWADNSVGSGEGARSNR